MVKLGVISFFLLAVACSFLPEPVQEEATTQRPPTPVTVNVVNPALQILPSLANLVESVENSVVSISVDIVSRTLFYDFTDEGSGTGMIFRSDGYVVTNFHVVQNANHIEVSLNDGRVFSADVVGLDMLTDLAVLKIDSDHLPTASFGDSATLRTGDWVVTIGNALSLKGGPSVTLGIISGLGRTIRTERGDLYDMIQTDAAINKGNSGGPLVNLAGDVVGINTAVYSGAQGVGFAVSSGVAKPIIQSLIENGKVVRPLIGLSGIDVTPSIASRYNLGVEEGILIGRISKNGPADKSGLQVMDVITALDGKKTGDMAQFLTILWSYGVGSEVNVDYVSDQSEKSTIVTLIERP